MDWNIRNWRISSKILLISFVSIVVLFCGMFFYFLPSIKQRIVDERMSSTKRIVESAANIAKEYEQMTQELGMPREIAQRQAMDAIKQMRYDNGNYVWINDTKPRMLMHPLNAELVGQDLTDYKDPNGFYLFREMVTIAQEKGQGGVSYIWPKPGVSKPVPKISYIIYYKPWDWIIGAGTYTDDIDAMVRNLRLSVVAQTSVLAAIMLLVTVFISRMIARPIKDVVNMIKDIAEGEGDLTRRINLDSKEELGELARWFNTFIEKLHDIIFRVADSTAQIASASEELAATAEEMAAGSNEQTAQTAQVATSMEEMSSTVQQVAQSSHAATGKAKTAGETAMSGGTVVAQTVDSMEAIARSVKELQMVIQALSKSSERIGDIVGVIDDVADQTNLLALNAAIEAARAGEQGRGFAVVADEVRKLAERTSTSTKEIADMVKTIQSETSKAVTSMDVNSKGVENGVRMAQQAGNALEEIVTSARSVQEMIQQIATAAEQQSAAAEEISSNVEAIASVSKQNTTAAQDTATAAQEISQLTDELYALVGRFKLRDSAALKTREVKRVHGTAPARQLQQNQAARKRTAQAHDDRPGEAHEGSAPQA